MMYQLAIPRTASLVAAVLTLPVLSAAPGAAEGAPPPDPEEAHFQYEEHLSESFLNDHVSSLDPEEFVHGLDPEGFVETLADTESDEEGVIVLETDILFDPNEWELPSTAGSRLAELVEEVPEGASVEVNGHTDSRPVDETVYDFDNQALSENRAQAVADALADERPDLNLTVEGFGDSDPAVDEDEDDPSTFAANRRVEIRHG
ncbi:OmpA family protein [Nesterenkonia muleiensis]|uniref:OmpA family protein n=1 Tax=Nesterenkonia muleiensis TaxID=2282648 RepID=UPI000E7426F5|nr:OmpA family protein [Nesterenkonia muleiensis]